MYHHTIYILGESVGNQEGSVGMRAPSVVVVLEERPPGTGTVPPYTIG
jgi:hypothetical protein